MKKWQVRYWVSDQGKNAIERWLDELEKDHLKAVSKEISILKEVGNELKLPHSKPLGSGLFELRERRYGYRVYYCFYGKQVIILLTAGNKSSQERDINIARERLLSLERK